MDDLPGRLIGCGRERDDFEVAHATSDRDVLLVGIDDGGEGKHFGPNPKGIQSISPGLPRPWENRMEHANPNGVAANAQTY